MRRIQSLLGVWILALALTLPGAASAQDITDAHLQAAWNAVRAVGADNGFDEALPNIAVQVQDLMVRQRPDLFEEIGDVVNDVVFELIIRRLDLNNDVARIWALAFTEAELNEITAFYNSSTGRKLADLFEVLLADTIGALENWYERLISEMVERSILELERRGITY